MSYKDLLYQYGRHQDSAEQRVYIYVQDPRKLKTPGEVEYRDRSAAGDIARLEKLVENLKDYRKALTARYGELLTMTYKTTLKLERCPHWKGHIEYIVTITKTMEDGTSTDELRDVYSGKDRHAALARYEELRKQRPGIDATKDIARRQWE